MSAKVLARVVAVLVAAAGLVGTAVVPQANAQPTGFPDLNRFKDVDSAQYVRPFSYAERWATGYLFFKTPDGISCAIGSYSWCSGQFPGLSDNQRGACTSVHQDPDDAVRQPFTFESDNQPCVPTADKVLSPGQKLTNTTYTITCVVGVGSLTACIDARNNLGFVLQPSGSWVF